MTAKNHIQLTKGIQAGIIRLHRGENDSQEPHSVDEVYYVIEGGHSATETQGKPIIISFH